MIEPGLAALILSTGFAVSCLSGLLGIGGVLSHRTSPRWLRTALAVVIALAAAGMIVDVVGGGLIR